VGVEELARDPGRLSDRQPLASDSWRMNVSSPASPHGEALKSAPQVTISRAK